MRRHKKACDLTITLDYLESRTNQAINNGYDKPKWVEFCEAMLERGYKLSLYEARRTFSKYVTVYYRGRRFKVRYSNHRPNLQREPAADCDFFVGVNHQTVTTTAQAIETTITAMES